AIPPRWRVSLWRAAISACTHSQVPKSLLAHARRNTLTTVRVQTVRSGSVARVLCKQFSALKCEHCLPIMTNESNMLACVLGRHRHVSEPIKLEAKPA